VTCADADAEVGVAARCTGAPANRRHRSPILAFGDILAWAQVLMPLNWQPCQPYDVYHGPDQLSVGNAYDINMCLPVVSDRQRDGPTRNPTQLYARRNGRNTRDKCGRGCTRAC